MPSRLSPLTAAVLACLEDGEDHLFNDIVDAVGPTIPPGRAFRSAEAARTNSLRGRGKEDQARSREKSKAEIISAGRRRIMWSCLWSLQKNGKIVLEGKGDEKKVRLSA